MANKRTKPGSPERSEIAEKVIKAMDSGMSCFKACQQAGVPMPTFMLWVGQDAELADRYAQARENFVERIAQEVMELSDVDVGETPDGRKDWAAVQKHKLQIDTRKWLLSKLAPKKYGEKLEISGDDKSPLVHRIELIAKSE
jgi:hypothetical protein